MLTNILHHIGASCPTLVHASDWCIRIMKSNPTMRNRGVVFKPHTPICRPPPRSAEAHTKSQLVENPGLKFFFLKNCMGSTEIV